MYVYKFRGGRHAVLDVPDRRGDVSLAPGAILYKCVYMRMHATHTDGQAGGRAGISTTSCFMLSFSVHSFLFILCHFAFIVFFCRHIYGSAGLVPGSHLPPAEVLLLGAELLDDPASGACFLVGFLDFQCFVMFVIVLFSVNYVFPAAGACLKPGWQRFILLRLYVLSLLLFVYVFLFMF